MGNKAVFLDRDGTIAEDINYCRRVEDFHILSTVPEAIRLLNENSFKVVIITNQSGIARGYFTRKVLDQIHNKLNSHLLEHGAIIDAIYYCPHHPNDGCNCRKPRIELFLKASRDMKIDLTSSFMIGDRQIDIDAGRSAGCKTILVNTGPETERNSSNRADFTANNLIKSVEWIIEYTNSLLNEDQTDKRIEKKSNKYPEISVIIPCYSTERLQDTLESVRSAWNQTITPHEVIVCVDHNPKLFSLLKNELPERTTVLLNEKAHGVSQTRNHGIRFASGEIIAFIDDDAYATKNWLETITPVFNNPDVMVVGGESTPIWPKGKIPYWFPEEFDWTIGCTAHKKLILQGNGEVRNINGNNMVFRSKVFEEIGLFETELGAIHGKSRGGEEANICLRVKGGINNSIIMFEPKAVVYHKIIDRRATLWHLFSYCWQEGYNRAKMRKTTNPYIDNPLSEETSFLRQLLKKSILDRLIKFYKLSSLAQIFAIFGSLICMSVTYFIGIIKYH